MAKVEIYSTSWCGYCVRARGLLRKKGVPYEDIDVEVEPGRRNEMIARSGGRTTVPQIFIDGAHIGDSEDLAALERAGKLDALLGLAP